MTEAAHSRNSASKFEAESLCPGRRAMTLGAPRSASRYAAEGTAAHQVLEWALLQKRPAAAYKGRRIEADGFTFEVDDDMAEAVQTALDNIAEIAGPDALVMAESRVYYNEALDTPRDESWGTADVIVLRPDGDEVNATYGHFATELQVHDYKHGRGVEVDADDNAQMKLYALGTLQLLEELTGTDGIENVRLVIHQPRIKNAPSEWVISVRELLAWGTGEARRSLQEREGAITLRKTLKPQEWQAIYLRPSEKACKFCPATATCPALTSAVLEATKHNPKVTKATADDF